ncbi:hypothetical protein ACFX14_012243 [Malus domestica]
MMTCIILHNMIVEDEYIEIGEDSDEDVDDDQPTHARAIARDVEYLTPTTYETRHDRVTLGEYMRRLNRIQAPQFMTHSARIWLSMCDAEKVNVDDVG